MQQRTHDHLPTHLIGTRACRFQYIPGSLKGYSVDLESRTVGALDTQHLFPVSPYHPCEEMM